MSDEASLSRPVIEALYEEALVLADDVRTAFAHDARYDVVPESRSDDTRLALSSEGLRTTTRVMHVLAWLLNQRAYLGGELTLGQVLENGTLTPDRGSDGAMLALLDPETRALIVDSERLHSRIARLDETWRSGLERPSPALSLQSRLERSLGRL